jgi:hypothetical protein
MCWYCGSPVNEPEPFSRSLVCAACGKDIRSCRNCRFYLSGARGDCSETSAERVADKERANFCDWFSLNPKYRSETAGHRKDMDKATAAKTAFDNLFS